MVLYRDWRGLDIFALGYYDQMETESEDCFSNKVIRFKFDGQFSDFFLK